MARVARIVLTGTRTDHELDPITLDLVLNDDGRVVQKFPTAGWWGSLKPAEDLDPFVFYPDGKLDFGSGWDDAEDRFARTNVPSKCITVGEYVTVINSEGEHCFVVKQVLWFDEMPTT